jgi:hypothetical protein
MCWSSIIQQNGRSWSRMRRRNLEWARTAYWMLGSKWFCGSRSFHKAIDICSGEQQCLWWRLHCPVLRTYTNL